MISQERLDFLAECASLSNDTWGETITGLLEAWRTCKYCSTEFITALEKEIEDQLVWAEENCLILERNETETRIITVKELVVNYD